MSVSMRVLNVCVSLLIITSSLVGCSRSKQDEGPISEGAAKEGVLQSATVPIEPDIPRADSVIHERESIEPIVVEIEPVAEEPVVPVRVSVSDLPFRICALFSGGGAGDRAGLVSRSDGSSCIVSVGDSFLGYKADRIDYSRGDIVFYHDDNYLVAGLSSSQMAVERTIPVVSPIGAPIGAGIGEGSGADLLRIKGPLFEPTPEENVAGIDPNAPDTWPRNYRGPTIERLMRESKGNDYELGVKPVSDMDAEERLAHGIETPEDAPEVLTEEDAFPDVVMPKFEPTASERAKSIDPNDPDSWPEDYMGPGIERALQKREESNTLGR